MLGSRLTLKFFMDYVKIKVYRKCHSSLTLYSKRDCLVFCNNIDGLMSAFDGLMSARDGLMSALGHCYSSDQWTFDSLTNQN